MNTQTTVRGLFLLLLFSRLAIPGLAASFSAELVETRAGETRTCPFHYQDGSYRFDVVEDGQTRIITVDGATGVMRVLVPSEKVYLEARFEEELSRSINPFNAFSYYRQTEDARLEGTESIGGLECRKVVVSKEGQVIITGWLTRGIGCPVKVETQGDARTVELRNIKHGPQEAELFAVPDGYAPGKPQPLPE